MKVFAIGDPHLSLKDGVLYKPMSVFGQQWENHVEKIRQKWLSKVSPEDVVFVVGDISWATKPNEALEDLRFLGDLPGQKVLIRGNHDYWWSSLNKVQNSLPPSCKALNGGVLEFEKFIVGGLRLWDQPDLVWRPYYKSDFQKEWTESDADILKKETNRLLQCLDLLKISALPKILLLHYPPTTPNLADTYYTGIIAEAEIKHCIFGHLHDLSISDRKLCYGEKSGVNYHLTACDWVDFEPKFIDEF